MVAPGEAQPPDPVGIVRLLAEEIGPRRPTGAGERLATERLAELLRESGCRVRLDPFRGYSTFAVPYGAGLALALASSLVPSRRRLAKAIAGLAGPALIGAEDNLLLRPLSRLLARRSSANLVATVEPRGEPERTVCLVCHLDSSRSGLMFHRRFLPWLHRWIGLQAAALAITALSPALGRGAAARSARAAAGAVLAVALLILGERELRGVDVPLDGTRVIGLFTGCEEAGVLGADAFLRRLDEEPANGAGRADDWRRWLFLNFDGVAAPASLHHLRYEGVLRRWPADPGLAELADAVARSRPELGLSGTDHNAGLTYDVTPVLARGGRAITFSSQNATIPNYHSPADTVENLDPEVLERALGVGREMLAAIDRGDADA
jgi:hypothetical protein